MRKYTAWGAVATAGGLAVAYVVLIMHFAVNIPTGDEWTSVVPLVHSAIHGSLTLGDLWVQHYNESHLLIPNAIFVSVGLLGSFNTRILILLSAILQVVSFGGILGVFRSYYGRVLTVLPVLTLGIVWFGLGAIDNALWGFQIQLYLTQFFIICMLLCLHATLTRPRWRVWPLATAILFAIAASCSTIQGLLAWPLGLMVLVWSGTRISGHLRRIAIWCGAAVAIIAAYFIDYISVLARSGCFASSQECSVTYGLHHVGATADYLLALLGNITPAADSLLIVGLNVHVHTHQLLGGVLLVASVLVVIRSYQHRRTATATWVPVTFILFGFVWDLTIALGRGPGRGSGPHCQATM